jgi:hypothetical protein
MNSVPSAIIGTPCENRVRTTPWNTRPRSPCTLSAAVLPSWIEK